MNPSTFAILAESCAVGSTIWDKGERGSVKGLHVRNKNGVRSYCLFYRTKAGKQRFPKIGGHEEITLGEARRRARAILDQVAAGRDPKGEWDASRAEPTLHDVFERCYQEYWLPETSPKWARDAKNFYTKNLEGPFGSEKLSAIRPEDVRRWLARYVDKPYAGNRSLEILSRLFEFAIEREVIPQGANPCKLVKAYREQKRDRYATPEELQRIHAILLREKGEHPREVAFLLMILYSGSRPSGIARATWDDLLVVEKDGARYGVLTFRGKSTAETGEEEVVIFPSQILDILETLPRIEGDTLTGLSGVPQKFWERVRTEAGCPDLWARDFRRTFGTIGLSNGLALDAIGELLNHKSTQTTKRYAKLLMESRAEKAAKVANLIESIVSK